VKRETIIERRTFLPSSLLMTLAAGAAKTSPIVPKETFVQFATQHELPTGSSERAKLYGDILSINTNPHNVTLAAGVNINEIDNRLR